MKYVLSILQRSFPRIVVILAVLLMTGCNFLNGKNESEINYLNNKITEQEAVIEELNNRIITLNEEIEKLRTLRNMITSIVAEDENTN